MTRRPAYAELINVLLNAKSVRSISLTEKRITVLLQALTIADSNIVDALQELLEYTGGWDVTNPDHPIYKARVALDKARKGSL